MAKSRLESDMNRLRDAVRAVRVASMLESQALESVLPASDAQTPSELQLHGTHLDELNAIQQLVTSMELIERLHPQLFSAATNRSDVR